MPYLGVPREHVRRASCCGQVTRATRRASRRALILLVLVCGEVVDDVQRGIRMEWFGGGLAELVSWSRGRL